VKKILLFLLLCNGAFARTTTIGNRIATMEINLQGGGIVNYTLNDHPLNPFSWKSKWNAGCEGFFLCFDRLGQPSPAEKTKGIPLHGEAHAEHWTVLEQTRQTLRVQCILPIAKMSVVREYRLLPGTATCRITDRFKNNNPFPKTYNILMHPSLGAPFLDNNLLVDCNASEGFVNTKKTDDLPGETVFWPTAGGVDLRHMKDSRGMVVNFRTAPGTHHGWVTIANPQKGLLVGYLWNTADYPWIRVWREWKDKTPTALGVEFGTTPLGLPLEQIKQVGDLMELPTLGTLPPGGETTHTFLLFLAPIPASYPGTQGITFKSGQPILEEKSR